MFVGDVCEVPDDGEGVFCFMGFGEFHCKGAEGRCQAGETGGELVVFVIALGSYACT